MAALFQTQLFRLLLFFSLIPALIIGSIGIYVSLSATDLVTGPEGLPSDQFLDICQQAEVDRLLHELDRLTSSTEDFTVGTLDLAFRLQKDSVIVFSGSDESLAKVVAAIPTADLIDGTMVIDSLGVPVHIRCLPESADRYLCGGNHYSARYQALLTILREADAQKSEQIERRKYLVAFVTVLLAVIVGLAGVVALLLSRRVSRSLAHPVHRLTQAVDAIGQGHFGHEVDIDTVDEFRLLIDRFNEMSKQLQSLTNRLAQSERVAAWRAVARQFAHELKNPLQPISISLYRIQKLVDQQGASPQLQDALGAVSEEIKHLTMMAGRFSDLAQAPPPNLQPTRLDQLIQSIAKLYQDKSEGCVVKVQLPATSIVVLLDPTCFREVLHNLIKNSREATPTGGTIVLMLGVESEQARLTLVDRGTGMAPNLLDQVRLPYYTTKTAGSGLGLAIADRIVSESGGHMTIESVENQGTTVTVILPILKEKDDSAPTDHR